MKSSSVARRGRLTVVVAVLLPLICGSVPPTAASELEAGGPGEAYLAYRAALDTGKLKKVKPHLSKVKVYEFIGVSNDEAIATLKVLDPLDNLSVVDEAVEGDYATVTARGEAMGMGATGTIEMIREGGDWKVLGELWELGGDPGAGEPVEAGASLQEAAEAGDAAAVKAAIDAGADVNAWDDHERTALSWATNYGRTEVMELLVKSGADPNRADEGGETPLMIAAGAGEPDALALLLDAGADANAADEGGRTALLNVAGMSDWSVDRLPNKEADAVRMVNALIGAGAEVDHADPWGKRTALMLAAEAGRTQVVRALIEGGADVNLGMSAEGATTAVMEAAKSGNVGTFRVLVDAGADLGGTDATGKTTVDWAADYPEIVEVLVEQGVEGANSVTSSLDEMRCAEDDPQPAIDRLKAKGYPEVSGSQLLNAAVGGESEVVMLMLRAGVPVNTKDEQDHATTALNRAVVFPEETDTALLLLSCGADPNAGLVPAIIGAAQKCNFTEVVQALLDSGVDPNTGAASGFSALQFAEMMECEENARILREAGAVEE